MWMARASASKAARGTPCGAATSSRVGVAASKSPTPGDRAKLVSADTRLVNNHIHHTGRLAFREAVRLDTVVGVTMAHNLLHDLPKGAVSTVDINNCLF